MSIQDHPLGRRAQRPERLTLAGQELVRNDVIAREHGTTERTLNRHDAQGAPFTYIGGVKYRPIQRYHEFLLSKVKVKGTPPRRKRAKA